MKIIGFGDSFTAGVEGDRKRSYIASLCQIPGSIFSSYANYAAGGCSNWAIAYQVYRFVMYHLDMLDNCFLFIAWTSFSRFSTLNKEFTDSSRYYEQAYLIPNNEKMPISSKLLIYETDIRILGVSNLLQKLKIPHAMIQAFDDHSGEEFSAVNQPIPNWINQNCNANTLMHILAERYLDHDFGKIEPGTNHNDPEWITKLTQNQYFDDTYHPTDAGNQLIAKTLYPYICV